MHLAINNNYVPKKFFLYNLHPFRLFFYNYSIVINNVSYKNFCRNSHEQSRITCLASYTRIFKYRPRLLLISFLHTFFINKLCLCIHTHVQKKKRDLTTFHSFNGTLFLRACCRCSRPFIYKHR